MKKLLYSVAIIAAVASCSKNEIDMTPSLDSQKTINFSTLNDRVASRAANDADDDYQVYAVSADGNGSEWFINEKIESDDNSIVSGNSYCWPTMELAFLAIAPFDIVTPSTFSATGNVGGTYTNPDDGQTDLTAAQVKSQGANADGNAETVALKFKHQLAKIIVRVSLDDTDVTTVMKDWTINNQAGVQIGDTQLSTTFTANNSVADFVFSATGDLSTITPATPATPQTMDPQQSTTAGSDSDINILPQTSTGCTIKFDNLIVKNKAGKKMNSSDTEIYTIKASDVTGDKFEANKVYILDLKISITNDNAEIFNGSISFSSESEDWINGESASDANWPADDATDADVAF